MRPALAVAIDAALPQTQCTRCGYPDCAAYADAIALGQAAINQCPPGGAEGIARLAAITGQAVQPLNPANGIEEPRQVAWIDENWCIGCTLCLPACPTDAIVGSNKRMHTVIEAWCTGCALCLPACPVDCIQLEPVSGTHTGWAAWSAKSAQTARERYVQHQQRMADNQSAPPHEVVATPSEPPHELPRAPAATGVSAAVDLAATSQTNAPAADDKKRATIEAILARARARKPVD